MLSGNDSEEEYQPLIEGKRGDKVGKLGEQFKETNEEDLTPINPLKTPETASSEKIPVIPSLSFGGLKAFPMIKRKKK